MGAADLSEFLGSLDAPEREIVEALRIIIKNAGLDLVEGIKWKAPSYSLNSNDIVTFNFRNYGTVALIFHTGPKGKDTHTGVHPFADETGLLVWLADKRFVLKVPDLAFTKKHERFVVETLTNWTTLAKNSFR